MSDMRTGDTVSFADVDGEVSATVLATDGDFAWVMGTDGVPFTTNVQDLNVVVWELVVGGDARPDWSVSKDVVRVLCIQGNTAFVAWVNEDGNVTDLAFAESVNRLVKP